MSAAALVQAVGFDGLRQKLKAATPAELDRLAQHWAGLPGRIADTARHLIDEEFEVRQAVARLEQITGGAPGREHDVNCHADPRAHWTDCECWCHAEDGAL